ncbi:PREDICTED: chromosome transmission fidelity protein 18 homolog [Gekko japonicus]|uniref:Chromosome transmission fidelity protein 18 homolog n=1 Tax=Gekko japonicus TaxID=146911 RepID=A0ABM1L0R5_GEKJA|nr:PREDICTED: chromosome transmission fidelity protein 18 homolog [Gekko japonicus]
MEEEEAELYGIEDEFDEQFADELEALAELEGERPLRPSRKVSEFRKQKKRTFEEALAAGDPVKDSVAPVCQPCLEKESCSQAFPEGGVDEEPDGLPTSSGAEDSSEDLPLQEAEATQRKRSGYEAFGSCYGLFASLLSLAPLNMFGNCGQKGSLKVGSLVSAFPLRRLMRAEPLVPTAPRPKRRRLEAVKKLDFGAEDSPRALEDSPKDGTASPLLPGASSELQEARTPRCTILDSVGVSDVLPLQVTPPEVSTSKKVLKRPPVLEDYINVTSTDGTRVFMAMKEDCSWAGTQRCDSLGWNRQRPLYLLGVPFSYLKEQVAEEHRRQIRETSRRLTEILDSCLQDEPTETEAAEPGEEGGGDTAREEDKSSAGSLWVDRFTPKHYVELLSDDYTNRCLLKWLKLWDVVVFGKDKPTKKAKPGLEAGLPTKRPKERPGPWKSKVQLTEELLEAELDQHNRPKFKVALLCGPPGLGKTTLAHIIAKHAGYNAVEMNASDDRSPDVFKQRIEAATQMKSVLGADERPNCLIIDEIDGAPTASINVLLNTVNQKGKEAEAEGAASSASGRRKRREGGLLLRPIICICNDQYVPSLRQLRQQSFLLHFPSTAPSRLVQRLQEIAAQQGMKADTGALTALCEKTENDIRSCINTLQFLHSRGQKELNLRTVQTATVGLKDQNKGLFSIWQEIFQLPKAQRHRIGMDPLNPVLMSGGDDFFGPTAAQASLNAAAQRFHRILHLGTSSGEHEKLTQGLYDNFLNMKVKDSSLGSVCLALEWLGFTDLVRQVMMHRQNFQLMRYLPFLPVAFHLLFAASNIPRLAYPNSQNEALAKLTQVQNLVASMLSGVAPNSRSRLGPQSLVLEALCLLLDILSPKLRPVNTQLYSQKEKQQLSELIGTMLAYNLTYLQERTPDGQYVYKLDPNVEEICRFPDLPVRRPLTYQTKQLIAREIELEKMRRTEAALKARNSNQESAVSRSAKEGDQKPGVESQVRNHEQRLGEIVKRATFEEKPETDFFGRVIVKKKASPSTANLAPEKNTTEKRVGRAVGQSDVWFRFNEGVSNAVRRNIYIKDLL